MIQSISLSDHSDFIIEDLISFPLAFIFKCVGVMFSLGLETCLIFLEERKFRLWNTTSKIQDWHKQILSFSCEHTHTQKYSSFLVFFLQYFVFESKFERLQDMCVYVSKKTYLSRTSNFVFTEILHVCSLVYALDCSTGLVPCWGCSCMPHLVLTLVRL